MPIVVNLDRVMLEHSVSLTELADKVGITLANLSIFENGQGQGGEV